MSRELNEQQRQFCYEYVSNGYNAYQAYKAAYPNSSEASIPNSSYRMMRKPEVKQFIYDLIKDYYEDRMIGAETIATELSLVAFQRREIDSDNYNESTKLKALELLQRQLGLQVSKVEAKVEQVIFINEEKLED